MKLKDPKSGRCGGFASLAILILPWTADAAATVVFKQNNTDDLNLGSSWETGVAPTAADIAAWDSLVTGSNESLLGADLSWAGIRIDGPGGDVTIGGSHSLTLGVDGINLDQSGPNLSINTPVVLGAAQTWTATAGRSLNVSGSISGAGTVTKTGFGSLRLSGTASNTFTSPLVIDTTGLDKTSSTFFDKSGGALAIPANGAVNFGIGGTGAANLRMLQGNQFGAGAVIRYGNANGQWGRFDLMGTNQTLAGLHGGTITTRGGAIVQNREIDGTSNRGTSVLTLNGNTTDPNYPIGSHTYNGVTRDGYVYNGYMRDADSGTNADNRLALVKEGDGTQVFAGDQIRLSGGVTINGGAIELLSGNVWDNASGMTTINAGGRLASVAAVNLNGGLTLNGGELAGLGTPNGTYGHWVLGSGVTVGGTSTSKITCDLRIGSNNDRTITVNPTGDPSGVDLDFTGTGRVGHLNGLSWGYLTKSGAGTLRFNNNGDIGRLTVNGGKVIFNEVFTGMGNGGLINNAQVDVINSTDTAFAQPVYGTGSLTKTGAGKLTLGNSNTAYTGTTTVAGGSLQFGTGNAISVASSNIATSGDLTFNHTNLLSYGGSISGTGGLIKAGSGTLVLTGNLSYTGTTSVTGGILSIPGNFPKPVSVSAGGGFLGGQSVSSLSLDGGSFHSTGSPLSVAGDLVLSGSNAVNLIAPPALGSGDILLMTYSGTLTGGAANLTFPQAALYRGTPVFTAGGGEVKLTGLVFKSLTWTGATDGNWDVLTTANWNDGTGADTFATGDAVVFGDTATTKTVALPASLISPSLVTFNNSTGNDYTISGNSAGRGFTGGTSIVKNGTGTATIQGYGHNYTGTVTINGGVLQPNGNYEILGNASGVTVNAGGQLNVNGMNLGSGIRHYSLTIAGQGPDGNGAITNTSTTAPLSNAGFLNLALAADASVGGNGGRFDFGRSGNLFGTITGNGHTLTKVGTGVVTMRGSASDIHYVVNNGTLKFEDSDAATGTNAIVVNTGTLQGYGSRRFPNALQLAGGTTLDSDGGGSQTWAGNIAITSAGNITLAARSGGLTLEGAISGNGDVTKTGNSALQFLGATSNSFTGKLKIDSTGGVSGSSHLVFGKTGGAVAVPAWATVELGTGTGGETNLRMLEDNQFGAGARMDFKNASSSWGRFDLMGTDQSLAGISSGTATTLGGGIVQNREIGGTANRGTSVLTLTGNLTDANYPVEGYYLFNGYVRDADSGVNASNKLELVKNGTGTQVFAGTNLTYSGNLTVNNGKLIGATARPSGSSGSTSFGAPDNTRTITVNAGGVLEFAAANMFGGHNTTAVPTLVINGGTVTNADPSATNAVNNGLRNVVLNDGTLTSTTGNSVSTIDASRPGEIYGAWGINGSVTSSGSSVISTTSPAGTVLLGSTGQDTVFDVTGGTLTVSAALQDGDASTLSNLIKNGPGELVLSGNNTYSTETIVNSGTVVLTESGKLRFKVTDYSNTRLSGGGSVDLRGAITIDTTGVTALNGSWSLVDTGTLSETYAASFTLGADWAEAAGVWTRQQGSKTWTFTEATGELTLVTPADSFEGWIGGYGLVGDDALPDADPDQDGIANSIEMALGGNPANVMDIALLPTMELVTNPAGMPAGDYLLFTYRRTDASVAASLVSTCQYDNDLADAWTTAVDGENGVKVLVDDNYDSFNPPAINPTDRVRVLIPRDVNPKLFGRLSVTAP